MDIAISAALNGLDLAQTQINRAAIRISNPESGGDVVSLSEAAVQLLQAKNSFSANISVLKTVDDITQQALNVSATQLYR